MITNLGMHGGVYIILAFHSLMTIIWRIDENEMKMLYIGPFDVDIDDVEIILSIQDTCKPST